MPPNPRWNSSVYCPTLTTITSSTLAATYPSIFCIHIAQILVLTSTATTTCSSMTPAATLMTTKSTIPLYTTTLTNSPHMRMMCRLQPTIPTRCSHLTCSKGQTKSPTLWRSLTATTWPALRKFTVQEGMKKDFAIACVTRTCFFSALGLMLQLAEY